MGTAKMDTLMLRDVFYRKINEKNYFITESFLSAEREISEIYSKLESSMSDHWWVGTTRRGIVQ
jgi:hypothetical protein